MLALPGEREAEQVPRSPEGTIRRRRRCAEPFPVGKPSILTIMLAFAPVWRPPPGFLLTFLPLFIFEHYHLSWNLRLFRPPFYMQVTAMVADPLLGTLPIGGQPTT